MDQPRGPRWAALVALPLLVGAVLLMHGLDACAHRASVPVAATSTDGHDHDTRRCEGCPGPHHVLAACVAVAATVATLRLGRSARTRPAVARRGLAAPAARAGERLAELARPPDPAWVRLSVMRC